MRSEHAETVAAAYGESALVWSCGFSFRSSEQVCVIPEQQFARKQIALLHSEVCDFQFAVPAAAVSAAGEAS
jgi:hypothetical protein